MDIVLKGIKPKYIEIYEEIEKLINDGTLKPNDKLPSKRDLAISLDCSINTIINSYNLLLDEGYIYSLEKKGFFVSNQITLDKKIEPVKTIIKKIHKPLYDFTCKNVDEFTNTNYKKIIRSIINSNDFLNKTPFLGDIDLRIQISNHLKINRKIDVSYESIIIASGIESLRSVLRILNIDNITLENPGYHKLAPIASNLGLKINYNELDSEGIIIPNYKTIIYSTPFNQFPTGIKMSISRKKDLSLFLDKTDSYLIEDDFDAEFRIKEKPTTSIYSINPNRVIFFSTFSTILYPGLRISYFILPPKIKEKYINHYKGYSSMVPTLDQLALKDFIKDGYFISHINKKKKQYLNKRLLIIDLLKKYNIKYYDVNY
ncbi:MAG: PLP-dependent aminotransferase family protein, partial [Acholeplasmatales bacterium]|nr:PLP-dependent aminotransferase family protein [Acholeplasmatales bacterium]